MARGMAAGGLRPGSGDRGAAATAGTLFVLALVLTPVTILLHELGHLAVPWLLGIPAALHPTSVSGGAAIGSGAPAGLQALQAGGGPLMTVAMTLAGAALFARSGGDRLWALAFAVTAMSRLLVGTAYLLLLLRLLLLLVLARPYSGSPNFDEHNVALALGLPTALTAAAATLFFLVMLWRMMRRLPRGRRAVSVLAMTAAIVAANIGWAALEPATLLRI